MLSSSVHTLQSLQTTAKSRSAAELQCVRIHFSECKFPSDFPLHQEGLFTPLTHFTKCRESLEKVMQEGGTDVISLPPSSPCKVVLTSHRQPPPSCIQNWKWTQSNEHDPPAHCPHGMKTWKDITKRTPQSLSIIMCTRITGHLKVENGFFFFSIKNSSGNPS